MMMHGTMNVKIVCGVGITGAAEVRMDKNILIVVLNIVM
jgi:hypothetical protein